MEKKRFSLSNLLMVKWLVPIYIFIFFYYFFWCDVGSVCYVERGDPIGPDEVCGLEILNLLAIAHVILAYI